MIKKNMYYLFLGLAVLLGGCASSPKQELFRAQSAVAKAFEAEAPRWAPTEYQAASAALKDGEEMVGLKKYGKAREILTLAELHALRALIISHQEKALIKEQESKIPGADLPQRPPPKKTQKPAPPPLEDARAETAEEPPSPSLPQQYTVNDGENLWHIAARRDIYADAFLWPILYRANRDQIRDPRQIYPGQVLDIPRNLSEKEKEEAIAGAHESDIFPIELILPNRHPVMH
jgi:nucleoid-associated protein YgaU